MKKLAALGLAGAMVLSVVGSSFARSTGGGSAGTGSGHVIRLQV